MTLPSIYINNINGEITKNAYINCELKIDDVYMQATIKGRGHSTWTFPKKPYNIKFEEPVNLLGLGDHKKWILLANWMDATSMRNRLALELANRIMGYVSKCNFVNLYMDNVWCGLYLLCEPIYEFDYLVEFDTAVDLDDIYFETNLGYKCNVKEPSVNEGDEGFLYIQNLINTIESDITNNNLQKMDLRSFVDYFLIQELTGNEELKHPKSAYMWQNKNGKLYAGPVWDFDWGTFNSTHEGFLCSKYEKYMWYHILLESPEFKRLLKLRWCEVKSIIPGVLSFGEEQKTLIKDSVQLNNERWPIKEVWDGWVEEGFDEYPNGDPELDFETSYNNISNWLTTRVSQIDTLISNL